MQAQHVFEGHTGRIFSIALCTLSDGRKVAASASHDRTVRVWCLTTFTHMRTLTYSDFVWRVFIVINPSDGKAFIVAFISTEDKIQVSDLETGETVNIFYGRLLFSGSIPLFRQPVIINAVGEEDISFVDVNNGEVLRIIHGGFEKVFRAVVSHNLSPVLVFTTWNAQNRRSTIQTYDLADQGGAYKGYKMGDSFDSGVYKWDPSAPRSAPVKTVIDPNDVSHITDRSKLKLLFEGDSRDGVTSLVITLTTTPLICSGHYDFVVRLWSIETKQLLMSLEGHSDYVGSVAAWKGHEPIVVSGSTDGTVKAWNCQSGSIVATGEGHHRDAWAVAVTTGPKPLIVSGSFDRTVRVWDINPILANLNWIRRKNFVLFLLRSGFLPSSRDRCRESGVPTVDGGEDDLKNSNGSPGDPEVIVNNFSVECKIFSGVTDYDGSNSSIVLHSGNSEDEKEKEKMLNWKVLFRIQSKVFEDNSLCRILASYL